MQTPKSTGPSPRESYFIAALSHPDLREKAGPPNTFNEALRRVFRNAAGAKTEKDIIQGGDDLIKAQSSLRPTARDMGESARAVLGQLGLATSASAPYEEKLKAAFQTRRSVADSPVMTSYDAAFWSATRKAHVALIRDVDDMQKLQRKADDMKLQRKAADRKVG